jgi:hypothetical protein
MPEAEVGSIADDCTLSLIQGKLTEYPQSTTTPYNGPLVKGRNYTFDYWFFCRPSYGSLVIYGDAAGFINHEIPGYQPWFRTKLLIGCGDGCVPFVQQFGPDNAQDGPVSVSATITVKTEGAKLSVTVEVQASMSVESEGETTTGIKIDIKAKGGVPGVISLEDDLQKSGSHKVKERPINTNIHVQMGTYEWECSKLSGISETNPSVPRVSHPHTQSREPVSQTQKKETHPRTQTKETE